MKKSNLRIQELKRSDIFEHTASLGYMPRWAVLLLDLALCVIAFLLSFMLGKGLFTYSHPTQVLPIWGQMLVMLGVQTIMFWVFHTYAGILRYSTFIDTIKVLLSVFSAVRIRMSLSKKMLRSREGEMDCILRGETMTFWMLCAFIYLMRSLSRWRICMPTKSKLLFSFWGGYRVKFTKVEFWQGRENRLHDRFINVQWRAYLEGWMF